MDNETESQELDRAYQEYAQVQQRAEQRAEQEAQKVLLRATAQAETMLKSFDYFLKKIL